MSGSLSEIASNLIEKTLKDNHVGYIPPGFSSSLVGQNEDRVTSTILRQFPNSNVTKIVKEIRKGVNIIAAKTRNEMTKKSDH